MVNKTISISGYLAEVLKKEINASKLIERLLREYYKLQSKEEEQKKIRDEELRNKKLAFLGQFKKNFFENNADATDEKFAEFLSGCSERMKIACGVYDGTNTSP